MSITVRTEDYLQQHVDKAVARFQRSLKGVVFNKGYRTSKRPHSLHAIYRVLSAAKHPLTYRDVVERLGLPYTQEGGKTSIQSFAVAGRLALLRRYGYVKFVGYAKSDYYLDGIGAQTYIALAPEEIPRVQRRIARARQALYDAIALIEQHAHQVPACMASNIKVMPTSPHHREMIELRLQGLTLEEVGQRTGVTRERVRQIQYKALTGRAWSLKDRPKHERLDSVTAVPPESQEEIAAELIVRNLTK